MRQAMNGKKYDAEKAAYLWPARTRWGIGQMDNGHFSVHVDIPQKRHFGGQVRTMVRQPGAEVSVTDTTAFFGPAKKCDADATVSAVSPLSGGAR